jgi:hypothetical protein
MKVLVLDIPDAAVERFLAAAVGGGQEVAQPAAPAPVKPPTQGVVAGMGEQSSVMTPKAPPMGVLTMVKLASHPWFQEWVGKEASQKVRTAADGDSLKLAQLYFGERVMKGRPLQEWGPEHHARLDEVVYEYETWAKAKGYNLDE